MLILFNVWLICVCIYLEIRKKERKGTLIYLKLKTGVFVFQVINSTMFAHPLTNCTDFRLYEGTTEI